MEACPKCRGEMEHGELHGTVKWAVVPADASFLTRLRYGLKLISVDGMRCKKCGFLEMYARS
jgi:predicted nucleic-acid-binding Zn-ribbon protein